MLAMIQAVQKNGVMSDGAIANLKREPSEGGRTGEAEEDAQDDPNKCSQISDSLLESPLMQVLTDDTKGRENRNLMTQKELTLNLEATGQSLVEGEANRGAQTLRDLDFELTQDKFEAVNGR